MIGLQTGLWSEPVKAGYSLRPYQETGATSVTAMLDGTPHVCAGAPCEIAHRSTLVSWATALGKTVLFCEQAKRRGGCLVIAHRDTLIRQAAEKLQLAAGEDEPVAIEKAQERAHFGAKFIVGSVQTIKGERLRRFALRFPDIEFIIFDEGHRATAKSYREIMNAFPHAKLLFVTATPDRSDGVGLKAVCESIAHEYNIVDATADGWLTPLRFVPVSADIDLAGIKITKQSDGEKDFDTAALDDAITREAGRIAAAVVKALESLGPTSRGIAFTPGVKTAHACAAALNTLAPGTAGVVDGEMSDAEKRPVLQAHREGRIRCVFNCNVLSEGYDDPTLDFVFDASPSHSRMRVSQRWGRVTRLFSDALARHDTPAERRAAISASPKPWAVVFDLVSNSAEHDVIGPDDLLAGKDLPPDVRKRVREIMNTEGGVVSDAVERAEKEAAEKKRRAWAAKCAASAASVTVGEPRSIFDRAGIDFIRRQKMAKRPDKLANGKMLALLKYRKIPVPRACSEPMFRRLLTMDQKREKQGKCRLGGIEWLRPFGVDAWKLSGAQAKRVHDAIKAKGYAKLTADELGAAIERTPGEEG